MIKIKNKQQIDNNIKTDSINKNDTISIEKFLTLKYTDDDWKYDINDANKLLKKYLDIINKVYVEPGYTCEIISAYLAIKPKILCDNRLYNYYAPYILLKCTFHNIQGYEKYHEVKVFNTISIDIVNEKISLIATLFLDFLCN